MIGLLPKYLIINNKQWAIRSDYRVALNIFSAFQDINLSEKEKAIIMLKSLYKDFESIPTEELGDAMKQASWFLDGGKDYSKKTNANQKKMIDWEQDEPLIFSAVNKVANKELRELDYMHWWTFLSYFQEMGECLYSTILNIRYKQSHGKKLEKHEQEFLRNNKEIVDLKIKYTLEEQEEIDRLNELLK